MDTVNILLSKYKNFDWDIRYDSVKKEFSIAICHPSWITSDMYQARILPYGMGKTMDDAFVALESSIK